MYIWLDSFKAVNRLQVDNSNDFYWNISTDIIKRIETVSYFKSRDNYKTFMIEIPALCCQS